MARNRLMRMPWEYLPNPQSTEMYWGSTADRTERVRQCFAFTRLMTSGPYGLAGYAFGDVVHKESSPAWDHVISIVVGNTHE